jgi:uncharacterized protein (DUF1697 family)
MPRHVAFLRAINVGGHTVRMERLRELFVALGFTRVETFIASGNVIFEDAGGDIDAMEERIERRLAEALGYEVVTFVRSVGDVAAVAVGQPFDGAGDDAEAPTLFIGFVKAPPGEAARDKVRALGMPMTMRNATTVRKLAAKYGSMD